jgi:hypothetical protein
VSVAASIKFTQGADTAPAGQALVGTAGSPVAAANGNDAGVSTWAWSWVDAPPASAIVPGPAGTANSLTFEPDVAGCYLLQLTVTGTDGSEAVDVRCFAVPQASGRIIPPFQGDDLSLNFAGVATGWDPIMRAWLLYLDTLAAPTNVDMPASPVPIVAATFGLVFGTFLYVVSTAANPVHGTVPTPTKVGEKYRVLWRTGPTSNALSLTGAGGESFQDPQTLGLVTTLSTPATGGALQAGMAITIQWNGSYWHQV